jgi:hypothetical protein
MSADPLRERPNAGVAETFRETRYGTLPPVLDRRVSRA